MIHPEIQSVLTCHLHKSDWCVRDVDQAVAEDLVEKYHYAGRGANTATYRHGLFHRDDRLTCYGVAWWIPPTKGAAMASWDGDWHKVLCLSRLVILPGLPTNAASYLLGKSIKRIRVDGVWFCLITYADTWRGHTGQIYKATNWEYIGMTKAEPVFIGPDGRLLSRKHGPRTRTRAEMLALGCTCPGSFPKHKYRIVLPMKKDKAGQMVLFGEGNP